MKKYELIKVLMNEQKDFNAELINQVKLNLQVQFILTLQIGNYLVDFWNMIRVKTYEAKAEDTMAKIKDFLQ